MFYNRNYKIDLRAPLNEKDSEDKTYGCRATNPDICKNCMTEDICAFVTKDHMCHTPSRKWKKYYQELLCEGKEKEG